MIKWGTPTGVARTALILGMLGWGGCTQHEESARQSLQEIDQACGAGQPEQARRILLQAAKDNPLFGEAYEGAKANWQISDDTKVNACGLIREDLRRRLRPR